MINDTTTTSAVALADRTLRAKKNKKKYLDKKMINLKTHYKESILCLFYLMGIILKRINC